MAELRQALDFAAARKTVDAMHLATAIHSEADLLLTRDSDLLKLRGKVSEWLHKEGLPPLRIERLWAPRGLSLPPRAAHPNGAA